MESTAKKSLKQEAFTLAFGKGRREVGSVEINDATLLLDRMGMKDSDPGWWFFASQTAHVPDSVAVTQLGDIKTAIDRIKTLDENQITEGIQLLKKTDALAERMFNYDTLSGWIARGLADHHLIWALVFMVTMVLIATCVGYFMGVR
ncbi:hypothetical protein [Acidithiobacillus caldus]|uniref:hypothetical protein n=1 Tax=Acidithiobacillus caldus TaxID=33059 RepID=UPI001C07D6BD|nr:hypothetical protein [Acidithiobacillus caldus]MBU2770093.1 hypothetical protein [Acidithiobacillus caldus]